MSGVLRLTRSDRAFFRKVWGCALCIALLTSCGTNRGFAEFEVYRTAYTATASTGELILDRLAIAEREVNDLVNPPPTVAPATFDPDLATYYSVAVDPPATAAYRRGLQAVQTYNDALYGLASGESADILAARVSALSALAASVPGEIGGVAGAAAAPTLAPFTATATSVNAAIKALEPLSAFALGFKTRAEFRERLLQEAGTIQSILATMRASTKSIFDAIFAKTFKDAIEDFDRNGALTAEEVERVVRVRELLSNWVVLMDGSVVALGRAVEAVSDESSGGSSAGLVVTGTELQNAARAARRNLAGSSR